MRRPSSSGFSLVEVIVAMALLGSVLIFISGLFVVGARQLENGRSLSIALSAARDVHEEMQAWGFTRLYDELGINSSQTAGVVDTRTAGYAQKWQPVLDQNLAQSHAEIDVESVDPGGGAPTLANATAIRIVVTVYWVEGERARSVRLVSVRV
jgi:prepilin-type N-terminal cleavage/methylation domain-containing protein